MTIVIVLLGLLIYIIISLVSSILYMILQIRMGQPREEVYKEFSVYISMGLCWFIIDPMLLVAWLLELIYPLMKKIKALIIAFVEMVTREGSELKEGHDTDSNNV